MHRAVLAILAAGLLAAPVSAYSLRFWPDPAYAGQAPVVVTLDFYDVYACGDARLKRVQPPRPGVIRLELVRGHCPTPPANPQHSVSTTLPQLAAGVYELEVMEPAATVETPFLTASLQVFEPSLCRPEEYRLCLHGGRFAVEVDWHDFADGQGAGHAVPFDSRQPFDRDTGFFWFFDDDNLELMVKVLDGCALNGRLWVFLSPASTVEYTVRVTDLATGQEREYHKDSGAVPSLTADTDALPCS